MRPAAFPRGCRAKTVRFAERTQSAGPTNRVHVWLLCLPLPHQIWRHGEAEFQWVFPWKYRAPVSVRATDEQFQEALVPFQAAIDAGVKLVMVYDQSLKWQRLSFDALRVFEKTRVVR